MCSGYFLLVELEVILLVQYIRLQIPLRLQEEGNVEEGNVPQEICQDKNYLENSFFFNEHVSNVSCMPLIIFLRSVSYDLLPHISNGDPEDLILYNKYLLID